MTSRRPAGALAAAVAAVLVAAGVTGCADGAPSGSGPVRVLAAASLSEAFRSLAARFEAETGQAVALSFAGSPAVARQVLDGAPVDVVATADEATMGGLVDAGVVATAQPLARNAITLVVEEGNPHRLVRPADVARSGLLVVACAAQVPCGRLADEAVRRGGVAVPFASREPDVRAVLTKVRSGEADAGFVYRTDARAAAPEVDEVPGAGGDAAPSTTLHVAVRRRARAAAREWVGFVTGATGDEVLLRFGFVPVR